MYKKQLPKIWKQFNGLLQGQCYDRRRLPGRRCSTALIRLDSETIALQFHETTIAIVTPNGIIIKCCDQKSPSVKKRISWLLPNNVSIIQDNHEWFLLNSLGHTKITDGINISWSGDVSPIKTKLICF